MAGSRGLAALVGMLVMLLPIAATARPVALADYLTWETAGGAKLSPDGALIAYRRTRVVSAADSFDADLWIMKGDGSAARLLVDASAPAWLPDGSLSYIRRGDKGAQPYVRSVGGVGPDQIGPERAIAIDGPAPSALEWSRDGRMIAYLASVPRTENVWPIDLPPKPAGAKWSPAPTIITGLQYRTGVDQHRNSDRHIFVVPADGGTARQLTSGHWNVGSYFSGIGFGTTIAWAADGKSLVFDGLPDDPDTIASAQQSRINRVDLLTGTITALTHEPGFWRSPRLSPDGTLIAYTGNRPSGRAFAPQMLRVMNADGSGDRVLIADAADRIFQLEWARDGKGILISLNHEGATKLIRVGLDGGQTVLAGGAYRFYLAGVADRAVIGSLASTEHDSEIGSVDLVTGMLTRLTQHNRLAPDIELAKTESFWARSRDGTRVQGWLTRPIGFDPARSYPLIVDIHGGPDAMSGYDFDFRYQDFAARGYIVLSSNPGGSTGYGSAFANRIDGGFPGTRDQEDLQAVLDAAVARGSIDASRIYVMGCSGGGSLSAWLAARTKTFAAAAVMCPVINWISFAGTTDATSWAYTRFARPFWEDPAPWLAHSPLLQAGKIATPMLFAVGARDQRTPVSQSAELYTALRVRGVPTRLLIFPTEGHGPWRSTPSNLLRLQLYLDEWFRTKGHPAAAP